MKKLLLLLLLPLFPAALLAQEEAAAAVRKREPFVPQHELRLTVGAFPILPSMFNWEGGFDGTFYDRTHRGPVYTSGTWSLSYDYRFKKWFDLGVTLSYYGKYSRSYSNRDSSPVGRNRAHAFTVMPVVRFTWVNSNWVRMYSTLGLGATVSGGRFDYDSERFRNGFLAFQLTPIGISVGRSFFGFAELGLGAQGVFMMGVGYKFKPRNMRAQ
ncbi:MAG: hypothetical protein K2O55_05965 [Alistipes sp.]|nr:hypothetical protein [Alistipes sp.]